MASGRFGTAINCMDGRVQLPLLLWMLERYHLDYVDMITEPGPEGILVSGRADRLNSIKSKVMVSLNAHGSDLIVVAGHHDCAGNPVTRDEHCSQVRKGLEVIRSWNLPASRIVGVWINENWAVEVLDSQNK